jgi:hypothetical protein
MRGILIHCLLATACAAGLAACGDDDGDDNGQVSNAGKGGDSAAGTGGTGGDGDSGTGGGGGSGGGSGIPAGAIACTEGAMECPEATTQTADGPEPCCTTTVDLVPQLGGTYSTSRTVGVCGFHFTDPARLPCFELAAPGEMDDECPQNLDQGWGHNPGCCHANFNVCGIINSETGCTLYRDTALKADGTPIGTGSGGWLCTPD